MSAIAAAGLLLNITKSLTEYLGLVESVSSDVKKLIHAPLLAANKFMESANMAPTKERAIEYMKDAIRKFSESIYLESNENLISAYLGLSICQYYLREKENAHKTFMNIYNIKLSTPEITRATLKDYVIISGLKLSIFMPSPIKLLFANNYFRAKRKGDFKAYLDKSTSIYNSLNLK